MTPTPDAASSFVEWCGSSADDGVKVFLPGEIEDEHAAQADLKGIPVAASVIELLKKLAAGPAKEHSHASI